MNQAILAGAITGDVTSGTTKNDYNFLKFTVVTKGKANTFHPCICWGKQADELNGLLADGVFVLVNGSIVRRTYGDDKRLSVEITVQSCEVISGSSLVADPSTVADDDLPF